MVEVEVHDDESLRKALKRFRYRVNRSGVLKEYRKRRWFTKPSERRHKRRLARERRQRRNG